MRGLRCSDVRTLVLGCASRVAIHRFQDCGELERAQSREDQDKHARRDTADLQAAHTFAKSFPEIEYLSNRTWQLQFQGIQEQPASRGESELFLILRKKKVCRRPKDHGAEACQLNLTTLLCRCLLSGRPLELLPCFCLFQFSHFCEDNLSEDGAFSNTAQASRPLCRA
jgi:hypothetical protein